MRKNKNGGRKSISLRRRERLKKSGDTAALLKGLGLTPSESALFRLHEVVNELERTLPPPRFFRAVIFGSARVKPGMPVYEETRTLARKLAEKGIDIVTGDGPGIMEAASRGGVEGQRKAKAVWSWGVCIEQLNREEQPNAYLNRAYTHGNFFTRLHQFARLGGKGAFIVMPGGIGSTLELAMMWQLLQVEHMKDTPLIAVGPMWQDFVAWATTHMVAGGYAEATDMRRVTLVNNGDEALPHVLKALRQFKNTKRKQQAGPKGGVHDPR